MVLEQIRLADCILLLRKGGAIFFRVVYSISISIQTVFLHLILYTTFFLYPDLA